LNKQYNTVKEAAEGFKVSRQTILEWLKKGRLTGRKPGGGKNSGWRFIQEAQQNQAAEKSN
jgi:excisionase family DNA binding protein